MKAPRAILTAVVLIVAWAGPADAREDVVRLPAAEKQRLIDLVRNHKCEDGRTIAQVLRYTERVTRGKFRVRSYFLDYGFDGEPAVSIEIDYSGRTDDNGEDLAMTLPLNKAMTRVSVWEAGYRELEMGAAPFAYQQNQRMKEMGAPHEAGLLEDYALLDAIPVKGKVGRLRRLLASNRIRIDNVLIEGIIPPLGMDGGSAVFRMIFRATWTAQPQEAQWIRDDRPKPWRPDNRWAQKFSSGDFRPDPPPTPDPYE